jgi:tetratricopeptide (TPR) repeat protein
VRILRIFVVVSLICGCSMAAVGPGKPLNVETKPSARQQLLYGLDLASRSLATAPRTDARYEAVFRAAGAFEILMMQWPSSPEAATAAVEQLALYEGNLLYGNVVKAMHNVESRGIANSDRGPDLYCKEGRAFVFMHDFAAADIAFRKAETHPAFHHLTPDGQSTIYSQIAWSYRERGDHRTAIQHYDRAARVHDAPMLLRASAALEAVLESERGNDPADRAQLLSHLETIVTEYRGAHAHDDGEAALMNGIEAELNHRIRRH